MSVDIYSRYADNTVVSIQAADGITRPTIIITTPTARQLSFSTYTWRLGDQVEYLSYSAYGDERAWWQIADANPEIMYWNDIAPGTQIRVPNA